MILKSLDGLAAEAVVTTKAGIQVLFLGPRLRGDDKGNLASANARSVPRRSGAPNVDSVITFENCYIPHYRAHVREVVNYHDSCLDQRLNLLLCGAGTGIYASCGAPHLQTGYRGRKAALS